AEALGDRGGIVGAAAVGDNDLSEFAFTSERLDERTNSTRLVESRGHNRDAADISRGLHYEPNGLFYELHLPLSAIEVGGQEDEAPPEILIGPALLARNVSAIRLPPAGKVHVARLGLRCGIRNMLGRIQQYRLGLAQFFDGHHGYINIESKMRLLGSDRLLTL